LACCCDQGRKEARRFSNRQVSTQGTEKAQVEAVMIGPRPLPRLVLLFSCLVAERPKAMIDWKKIRKRAKTAALLSIMTAGYLAPGLI
jgi:hypothetical protein